MKQENVKILSDTDDILESFKDNVMKFLRDNLVCLLHHGSRAKGEARPDSDYDSVIITKRMNKEVVESLQDVFSKYPQFSFYLLSLDDLKTMPRGHYLEFLYAKPLYGSLEMKSPTKEEVISYINHKRRDALATIRHTLIIPHSNERIRKNLSSICCYEAQTILAFMNSFWKAKLIKVNANLDCVGP